MTKPMLDLRIFAIVALSAGTLLMAGCSSPDPVTKTTTTEQSTSTTPSSAPVVSSSTTTTIQQTRP